MSQPRLVLQDKAYEKLMLIIEELGGVASHHVSAILMRYGDQYLSLMRGDDLSFTTSTAASMGLPNSSVQSRLNSGSRRISQTSPRTSPQTGKVQMPDNPPPDDMQPLF